MPGIVERMELRKVSTVADDDSLDEQLTEPTDCEKATMSSQYNVDDNDDGESNVFLTNGIPKRQNQFNGDDNDDGESHRFLSNGIPKKKTYEEEYHPGHASFGMSVFNLSNAIMGSGILGLSFAMANTGIILFTVLLIAVAILSLYSVHLLLVTAKEGGSLIYEKLGERAFGWPGKMAAFGSIIMQNIGAMSSYLFIVKYELPEVIRAFLHLEENSGEWYLNGNYLVLFVSAGIILPLSLLKNLGYLGYTSGFSLSCMVFFLGVIIYKKTQLPCPLPFLSGHSSNLSINGSDIPGLYALQNKSIQMDFSHADISPAIIGSHDTQHSTGIHSEPHPDVEEMCTPKYFVFNSQTAYTVPILAFAFVCHPEVLPIYSELKDRSRKKMQNVSNLSILAMLIMYMLSALFGYLTFYDNVEAELLHTFTKVYKFDTMLLLVRLAVLTAVTLTVPIVLFPIRSSITTLLFSGREFSWTRHLLIAAFILVFNNVLVICVPTIRDIFGFIGASAATMLIFILPAAFYLRLVKSLPLRSPQKIGAAIFLVVGVIFMTGSLTLIVLDWIHNPPGSGGHH
ncbi:sodium-coupled neutral amino acid transporter 4 isoform X2 [Simochromis diagramma]|uniref:sodium-coupled neutral amino acid transporter 4 isoform X2 n=1 Tax=Simochromis diagramma TaxID=43689 RepID=UPI001A7EDA3A|nr:sodium-coupled neutral amino acid transporter 4 isoform X2 [Simochromis diagramma]